VPELRLENSIVDDRFQVETCLGRGSYAEIFLAYDSARYDEPVIIKALNSSLQGTPDPDLERTLVQNFQNEAIALDKVRHPHIIRRLGHGTAADLRGTPFHYLLLEYMPGGDLLSLCRHNPFGLSEAINYFKQVAEALAYAHRQQVIHRDIKPNNLLLSEDHSIVKIADFGVAKMELDDSVEITRVGTNVYAPPEHHPDTPTGGVEEKLTPSADIYSLAKTIYTAMSGQAPRQFARQQITSLPAALAREPWGDALLEVLKKATALRPADRYQSVQEFWGEFARLQTMALSEAADDEIDAEATVVRARLSGTSTVTQAATIPNFQALTTAPQEVSRPRKARIVVDLPQRPAAKETPTDVHQGPAAHSNGDKDALAASSRLSASAASRAQASGGHPSAVGAQRDAAYVKGEVVEHKSIDKAGRADLRGRKTAATDGVEQSFFESLRALVGSEWLRRVFIAFMLMALVGVSVAIYDHYANKPRRLPPVFDFSPQEGSIVGAARVNLRSEPWGDELGELALGTRVRVLDNRGNWRKVKVIEWVGAPPDSGYDEGWVDGRYVRLDQR
jgi:serine/threonine-protein kinase